MLFESLSYQKSVENMSHKNFSSCSTGLEYSSRGLLLVVVVVLSWSFCISVLWSFVVLNVKSVNINIIPSVFIGFEVDLVKILEKLSFNKSLRYLNLGQNTKHSR